MRSKVKEAARELGLDVELKTLDESTATVAEAAAAIGCAPGQIAKSIVFVMDGEPIVVVASGRHRIDPDKVRVRAVWRRQNFDIVASLAWFDAVSCTKGR